ncbi:sister chromatid cohesion protein PDS5 homolog A-like, partial [Hyla sarda]|uniref:sister chromatid cohesion protein PDS5 homolog A-like n=1 Tax=Hyla sarda TaxID=327740 RepID=UPI0024C21B10
MVVKTFMDMDQDSEDEKQQYLPLALHLSSEFFLRNPNKDVRLLVACCLADIFRIYAPEAPYTSHDKLKDIFLFITRQLKGLEDTKSPQFNRYFYLLENLAWVKSYNICFELEDCNEIFIQLFKTLFSVINNSHNQKVQMHMLDLMSSITMEGDGVTQELLDSILINLIPAHKNLNKQAFDLAKVLLKRTVQTIEPCIANFFNQVLVLGKSSVSDLSEHVFDLIQELFAIDPNLLLSVMPQLEFKLKSNDGEERLAVVRLLAKLFGSKDSDLANQNRPLWQCFLGRFNDIHVPVRLESVKFASHCLMNHPDLAKDLTGGLLLYYIKLICLFKKTADVAANSNFSICSIGGHGPWNIVLPSSCPAPSHSWKSLFHNLVLGDKDSAGSSVKPKKSKPKKCVICYKEFPESASKPL